MNSFQDTSMFKKLSKLLSNTFAKLYVSMCSSRIFVCKIFNTLQSVFKLCSGFYGEYQEIFISRVMIIQEMLIFAIIAFTFMISFSHTLFTCLSLLLCFWYIIMSLLLKLCY